MTVFLQEPMEPKSNAFTQGQEPDDQNRYDIGMEADFWKGCVAVETIPGRLGGRPVVKNSRVAADTIVEAEELGETAEETADNYGLDVQDVLEIRSYAHHQKAALAS